MRNEQQKINQGKGLKTKSHYYWGTNTVRLTIITRGIGELGDWGIWGSILTLPP